MTPSAVEDPPAATSAFLAHLSRIQAQARYALRHVHCPDILAAGATLAAAALALVLAQGVAVRFTMGAFALQIDRTALLVGCAAGLGLGVFGAIPPAVRAFRMPIPDALKAV